MTRIHSDLKDRLDESGELIRSPDVVTEVKLKLITFYLQESENMSVAPSRASTFSGKAKRDHPDSGGEDETDAAKPIVPAPSEKKKTRRQSKVGGGRIALGSLERFTERAHWAEQMLIWKMAEPARGQMTARELLVVQVTSPAVKGSKVGPGGEYELQSLDGMSRFLEDEWAIAEVGLAHLPPTTTHGVKYLLDVTKAGEEAVERLPTRPIKLAKGVGLLIRKLGDASHELTLSGILPSWMKVDDAAKTIGELPWIGSAGVARRVRVNDRTITDRFTIRVTPKLSVPVTNVTLDGRPPVELGATVEELMGSERINLEVLVRGFTVALHRAACCSYCGFDDHLQATCELFHQLTSDEKPTHAFRIAKKAASVKPAVAAVTPPVASGSKPKPKKAVRKPRRVAPTAVSMDES